MAADRLVSGAYKSEYGDSAEIEAVREKVEVIQKIIINSKVFFFFCFKILIMMVNYIYIDIFGGRRQKASCTRSKNGTRWP